MEAILKAEVTILYKNGKVETFHQEATKEVFQNIGETINDAYKDDLSAVIRLNDDNKSNIIRVSDTSRVTIEFITD